MDEILWNTEQKKVTILVCIDLSAAFNMVNHSVLIKVLNKYYGISGSALQWFESYLVDRHMKVSVGDVYSETKRLSFSVPQGSCGGPIVHMPTQFQKSSLYPLVFMHLQVIMQFWIVSTLQ